MIALSGGLVVGAAIGASVTLLVSRLRSRRRRPATYAVSAEQRDELEANFAAHVGHLRSQVADFADRLAGDDVLLRERLRGFESGDRS